MVKKKIILASLIGVLLISGCDFFYNPRYEVSESQDTRKIEQKVSLSRVMAMDIESYFKGYSNVRITENRYADGENLSTRFIEVDAKNLIIRTEDDDTVQVDDLRNKKYLTKGINDSEYKKVNKSRYEGYSDIKDLPDFMNRLTDEVLSDSGFKGTEKSGIYTFIKTRASSDKDLKGQGYDRLGDTEIVLTVEKENMVLRGIREKTYYYVGDSEYNVETVLDFDGYSDNEIVMPLGGE